VPLFSAIGLALILLGAGLVTTGVNGVLGTLSVAVGLVMMTTSTTADVLRRRAERDSATPRDIRLARVFPAVVLVIAVVVFVFVYGFVAMVRWAPG
jgi:Na+(H+)/acetate symporter ActP